MWVGTQPRGSAGNLEGQPDSRLQIRTDNRQVNEGRDSGITVDVSLSWSKKGRDLQTPCFTYFGRYLQHPKKWGEGVRAGLGPGKTNFQ